MTRTISLITAVAGLALVLAVPALGKGQPVPRDFWNYDESGAKITNTSPGLGAQDLGSLYATGGRSESPIVSPDAVERAVAAREAMLSSGQRLSFDDHRAATGGRQRAAVPLDAFERAVAARNTAGRTLVFDSYRAQIGQTSAGRGLVFDNHRIDPVGSPTQVTVSDTGRDLEWPQIGLGLGIGIALMLGLFLTLRLVHVRQLAH
jgi:hypothetical protein